MKKHYVMVGMAALFASSVCAGNVSGAEKAKQWGAAGSELQKEVQQLRALVEQLNKRLNEAEKNLQAQQPTPAVEPKKVEKKLAGMEDDIDELDKRVSEAEKHTVMDRLTFNVDLRTEYTSLHYGDARVLPEWNQSMLSLWAFNKLAVPFSDIGVSNFVTQDRSGPIGAGGAVVDAVPDFTFNPAFAQRYTSNLMAMMGTMLQGNFLSGFYLPTGGGGMPANSFMTRADALAAMGAGMSFPADAMPVIQNNANGKPLFGPEYTLADMAMYQSMFNTIVPEKKDIDNDGIWTTRARFDIRAEPHPKVVFGGRLSANKVWGDSTGVKWFSGDFSSVTMDGNVSQKGSDSAIRLERGFVTYKDDWEQVPWHFSLGRRPATEGQPWEVSTHSVIGGSPLAHGINFQFDGASLGFDLSQPTGIPGFNFKACYGFGFESGAGSGNSYAMDYSNDVDDVNFAGYIWQIFNNDKFKVLNMYAHAFDITDGFTGLVAMPFAISGVDANGDGRYDAYFLDANRGGYVSRMEAFTNIGSMDLTNLLFQGKLWGNTDLFLDVAASHTRPNGISKNPMMQFMGTDTLLGSNGVQDDQWGYSVWAGAKTPVPWTKGFIGAEFNWGSQYWLSFNQSEDTINASKLAARGKVYELYYHQPLIDSKLLLSMGAQFWDYDYSLSGSPLGKPKKISELTALDSLMPVPETLWAYYMNLNYRW